jgi:hypothetical protein
LGRQTRFAEKGIAVSYPYHKHRKDFRVRDQLKMTATSSEDSGCVLCPLACSVERRKGFSISTTAPSGAPISIGVFKRAWASIFRKAVLFMFGNQHSRRNEAPGKVAQPECLKAKQRGEKQPILRYYRFNILDAATKH